ncbi:unnamed protein product [Echinostoma caproni]|uniref:Uncharacterized protein n=1 Tax=Echinostoma caproni TaxID=27848 RepID=A0A3P8IPB8_9TREM|nr:unnamed protein product [Echinostoma caproni]
MRVDVKNHVAMFTRSGKVHDMGSVQLDLYKLVGSGPITDWYSLSPLDDAAPGDNQSQSST